MTMAAGNIPRDLGRPIWHPAALIATWFGSGLLPRMPGTWGSLAALPFAWVILVQLGPLWLLAASLVLFFAGCWASAAILGEDRARDPGYIVVDEVAGQFLALAPAAPDPTLFAIGFVLFRLADIVKPWPASWADREVKGGLGVMLDDMVAGGYVAVIMLALGLWWE